MKNNEIETATLQVGDTLVVNSTIGTASVTPGDAGTPVAVTGASLTFGPYDDVTVLTVRNISGTTDLTRTRAKPSPTEQFTRKYKTTVYPPRRSVVTVPAGSKLTLTGQGYVYGLGTFGPFQTVTSTLAIAKASVTQQFVVVPTTQLDVETVWADGIATPAPTPTPTPGPTPSPSFSRMATTQAADSDNNSTLITALAANNARPTYTLAANTPRTIAWKIGAVADPGAFIAYIVDKSDYTAVAEQSFDSTNGTDGTWTRLTDAIVFPAGGTSSQGAANTRQIASVASGAARWVRLTLTHTATANVYYPAVYQRPASGNSDVWLGTGPSLEGYGMWSKLMEDAIIAAYPARDPVFLRYANGGTTVSTVKNYPAQVAATHWANLFSYVMVGSAIGNDITDHYPISDDSAAYINTVRADYDALLNGFPGKAVFPCRVTYRAYTNNYTVTLTDQEGGSLGYNKAIVDPSVAANQVTAYDASLLIPRVDLYSAAMRNRNLLQTGDPTHFGNYNWYRAEWVRTAVRFAYTGTWPTPYVETLVATAESTKTTSDIAEAQAGIASLVASSAKSALQARLDAAANNPSISFSVSAVTVAENVGTVSNTINVNRNGVTGDLVVNLATAGTATSGSDYAALPATVTVLAANSSVSFDVTINDDATQESSETITITATLTAYPSVSAQKTITVNDNDGAGTTYSPEATSYFAAMSVQPTDTRKSQLDALIVGLKNDGVLAKLGRFNILAAHDAQAARVGVVDPTKSLAAVNNPVFTVDRGYEGGGSQGHLDFGEGYAASGKLTQDDLVVGAWCNLTGTETGTSPHMGKTSSLAPSFRLSGFGTSGSNETYNLNDGTNSAQRQSTGGRLGHRMATRVGTAKTPYFNGVKGNVSTVASTGAPTGVAAALRNDTAYSTDRLAAVYFGAALTDAEATSIHNRLSTYLTAIGAA